MSDKEQPCERCGLSLDDHFPFAGTGLPGVVRQQGVFGGAPGPFCPATQSGREEVMS